MSPSFFSDKGVSSCVINTEKGFELFSAVKDNFEKIELSYDQIILKNGNLLSSLKEPSERKTIYKEIDNIDLNSYMKSLLPKKNILIKRYFLSIIPRKIKNFIKRVLDCKI